MKIPRLAFVLFWLLPMAAYAVNEDNEGSVLSLDANTGAYRFTWNGTTGRTYFILYSETLMSWAYLPIIEQGAGETLAYGLTVSSGTNKFFLRLRYTDQPATDPYTADFDSDGIPNGWELENGLNPFDSADASNVSGGLTYLQIYQQSLGGSGDPTGANAAGMVVFSP